MIILEVEILRGMFWKGVILHFVILSIVEGLSLVKPTTSPSFMYFSGVLSCLYSYLIGSWQSLRRQIEHFALPVEWLLCLLLLILLELVLLFFITFAVSFYNIFHLSFIMLIIYYDSLRLAMMVFSHLHYNVSIHLLLFYYLLSLLRACFV